MLVFERFDILTVGNNLFWSCCQTGETNDSNVLALRSRQMKNFHVALMISQVNIIDHSTVGLLRGIA